METHVQYTTRTAQHTPQARRTGNTCTRHTDRQHHLPCRAQVYVPCSREPAPGGARTITRRATRRRGGVVPNLCAQRMFKRCLLPRSMRLDLLLPSADLRRSPKTFQKLVVGRAGEGRRAEGESLEHGTTAAASHQQRHSTHRSVSSAAALHTCAPSGEAARCSTRAEWPSSSLTLVMDGYFHRHSWLRL